MHPVKASSNIYQPACVDSRDADLVDILYEHDRDRNLYHFLNSNAELEESITVGELIAELETFSEQLRSYPSGARALLVFPTSKNFLIAFFGCLHAGIIPVPVSAPGRRNGIELLESIDNDCSPQLLIFDTESYERLKSIIANSKVANLPVMFASNSGSRLAGSLPRRYNKKGIAFLQYTSGSTSKPKGVVVTHRNIVANQQMIQDRFKTDRSTIFLGWTPLHHDMGLIGNVMQPMYVNCECYLLPPITLLMRPKTWLKVLSEYKITVTGGPNFSYKHILKRVKQETIETLGLDLSSLKVLYNGSEPIEIEVMREFVKTFEPYGFGKNTFLPCYGLAEATLLSTGDHVNEPYRSDIVYIDDKTNIISKDGSASSKTVDNKRCIRVVSCGPAVTGVNLRIREHKKTRLLPPNKIGVIEIQGCSVTPGYWSPDISLHADSRRWLNTGDLGFMDEIGNLYVCGRVTDLIIVDGRNIYPQDLELIAESANTSLDITGYGAFATENKTYLVAEVSKKSVKTLSLSSIKHFKDTVIKEISKRHGVGLSHIVLVKPNSIPRTTSFKIQRQKLKSFYLSNQLTEIQPNE